MKTKKPVYYRPSESLNSSIEWPWYAWRARGLGASWNSERRLLSSSSACSCSSMSCFLSNLELSQTLGTKKLTRENVSYINTTPKRGVSKRNHIRILLTRVKLRISIYEVLAVKERVLYFLSVLPAQKFSSNYHLYLKNIYSR